MTNAAYPKNNKLLKAEFAKLRDSDAFRKSVKEAREALEKPKRVRQ